MKKLLLGLGAIASVAAPVAAVVACGSTDSDAKLDVKLDKAATTPTEAKISGAFTASLNKMDNSGHQQSTIQTERNFRQFIGYVRDVINGTHEGRYLSGPFKTADDVKDLIKAAKITAADQAAAKAIFETANFAFTSTYGEAVEATNIPAAHTKLADIFAAQPNILKAALLLQIGHINVGNVDNPSLVAHKGEHILIVDQINDALEAAGYATVKADTLGASTFQNDAADVKVEKDSYKANVLAFEDASKSKAALVAIAGLI